MTSQAPPDGGDEADPAAGQRGRVREQFGRHDQIFERVDADDRVLPEDRVDDRVVADERARVRLGHPCSALAAAHLEGDDGLAGGKGQP